ncbi:MAG: T9SS C-terminal target domain-containing protein [Bacteroidetes bacterium]|nr:MAG: T9SS C-terminal target domain-containing protein [Bacteroidota bacterium]REK04793.1 MAG: T9SS C-terminal target domain-containing protein [Bacteroidota bacterium]REK36266.1 MAG: T9SS C-terminal target domain-containing protein [Bacteroidota bacterium]REK51070.1 MAG: T9SS C-terminal target domain-containing protein [Bacteroidota bacterium]
MFRKFFTLLILFAAISAETNAQQGLHISRLQNFPALPNDTAYGNITYQNILITVSNNTVFTFTGSIDVLLSTRPATLDTLYSDSGIVHTINPGDSLTLQAAPYVFNPQSYDSGDNIVVIWPQARGMSFQTDSTVIVVHFVLFQNILDQQKLRLSIFPNPTQNLVRIQGMEKYKIEYVRIFNAKGIEIRKFSGILPDELSLEHLNRGIYFIEFRTSDFVYTYPLILE